MSSYSDAKQVYAEVGVDTELALTKLDSIPISLHCWQGDEFRGFEGMNAKNSADLRNSMDKALALVPGAAKINLHAMYGEFPNNIDRDTIDPTHFKGWLDWAKEKGRGIDFNPTLFNHTNVDNGLTLSHPSKNIRDFWIEHVKRCRNISAFFGESLKQVCVMNLWIPDGFRDAPVDQLSPRRRLEDSLDEIYRVHHNPAHILDVVEGKLFGVGKESYTVGSHEFYYGYAAEKGLGLCLDTGHLHPTETVSSKISAVALFISHMMIHVSRPVRWSQDHVVLLDDELINLAKELVRHDLLGRVHISLDYFEGTIDRITAWAIGARNMRKALLIAALEPYAILRRAEDSFDLTRRLALLEECKMLPWVAVWDEYCERKNVPKRLAL